MNRLVNRICLAGALFFGSAAVAAGAPQIGDKAPVVKVAQWVTRQPPVLPGDARAGRHVFLIEFWATWCPPCLKSIPHLAELHRKHAKDGLVVVGVSNEEPETIGEFIKKKQKMPYHVASDDEMTTTKAWTEDIAYIPYAFLVDRTGIVVWQGNPLDDREAMDKAVVQLLAGKYDLEAAKRAAKVAKEFDELMSEVYPAYAAGDREKLFRLLDRMIALKPLELHPYVIKRDRLREYEMVEKIPAWDAKILEVFNDSAAAMRRLAAFELEKDYADRDPAFLLRCAVRANDLAGGRDAGVLSILARVWFELGMLDNAITRQRQAVALASKDTKDRYRRVLAYYEAARRLAREQRRDKRADDG